MRAVWRGIRAVVALPFLLMGALFVRIGLILIGTTADEVVEGEGGYLRLDVPPPRFRIHSVPCARCGHPVETARIIDTNEEEQHGH